MNGEDFVRIVNEAFTPFLTKLGFSMDPPSISGRFYHASFTGAKHKVSVSFEPGDWAFFIFVASLKNGQLSDIDDRLKTPRLSDLNSRFMRMVTNEERAKNEAAFQTIVPRDDYERVLLEFAKELLLVLPKYLARSGI